MKAKLDELEGGDHQGRKLGRRVHKGRENERTRQKSTKRKLSKQGRILVPHDQSKLPETSTDSPNTVSRQTPSSADHPKVQSQDQPSTLADH